MSLGVGTVLVKCRDPTDLTFFPVFCETPVTEGRNQVRGRNPNDVVLVYPPTIFMYKVLVS